MERMQIIKHNKLKTLSSENSKIKGIRQEERTKNKKVKFYTTFALHFSYCEQKVMLYICIELISCHLALYRD